MRYQHRIEELERELVNLQNLENQIEMVYESACVHNNQNRMIRALADRKTVAGLIDANQALIRAYQLASEHYKEKSNE